MTTANSACESPECTGSAVEVVVIFDVPRHLVDHPLPTPTHE